MLSIVKAPERKCACHRSYDTHKKKAGDHIKELGKLFKSPDPFAIYPLFHEIGWINNCSFGVGCRDISSCDIARQIDYPGQCVHYRQIEDPRSVMEEIIYW